MKIKHLLACASILLAAPILTGQAEAAPAWEFVTPGNNFSNGVWNFATAFTANTDLVVSGMGFYADPLVGTISPVPTALYECADAACLTTGTLIASATVDNTYSTYGHFRYVTVAPVTLKAGTSYEVAGVSKNNKYSWNNEGYADNPAITRLNTSGSFARWAAMNTPDFLTGSAVIETYVTNGYLGPNLFFGNSNAFTGAPEPAAWMTMILGFGAIGVALRRQPARAIA